LSNRIKILIIIDWFLPGTLSGGPVRSYANLIEHLKDDFEFYIITRNSDYGLNIPYEGIIPNIWTKFNDYTKVYYISKEALSKSHLKRVITDIEFDIAFVNGIYSWYFSILPVLLLKKSKKKVIVSARGMLNPQAFSVKARKKIIYLKLARLLNIYSGVIFHATNTDEAVCIKNRIGKTKIVHIAPNLPRKQDLKLKTLSKKNSPVKFVNIARISIEKGTLRMLSGLEGVEQSLILDLYGPIYDKQYWVKCKEVISRLPKHIKVSYKGVLESESILSALTKYDFFVLLSEGENFGHAILEALSVGLPVIISDQTPWRDLEAKLLGWDINANEKLNIVNAYTDAINMSNSDYKKWSQATHEYATLYIDNPDLVQKNKKLFTITDFH
jgi:glycosyltransferase involved in cell wall biosynthesis